MVDAPRNEMMTTALVINVDQAQSEIVALNPQVEPQESPKQAENPVANPVEEVVVTEAQLSEAATKSTEVATEQTRSQVKRASNDPRMRRRQQREAQQSKVAAPKVQPSQIPELANYTLGSLIRHIYGEDCTVLIEQFGLVPTFNRALIKFTEQYASSQVAEAKTVEEDKKPVTRDAQLPSKKALEESEAAEVLPLTPPETPATRVANDPRERRRLAKLAAEQAHEQAKQAQAVPKAETGNEQGAEIEAVASETVASATEAPETVVLPEQSLETATPVSKQKATAPTETAQPEVKAELEKVSTAAQTEPVQAELNEVTASEQASEVKANDETTEKSATQETAADADKPSRPRRPRGRPPKKASTTTE